MIVVCDFCGISCEKKTGHVNRSRKLGHGLFCSLQCAGKFKRKNKTSEQKKLEKKLYDAKYRNKNYEYIRERKIAYFKKDYYSNPEKYKQIRKAKQPKHNEYCRRPEYKAWKKEYDQKWRAKKTFGEFWEAQVALLKLDNLIETKMSNYEIRLQNKTLNKALNRSRNGKTKRSYT